MRQPACQLPRADGPAPARNGFTLIELMIVVLVIGVLAAIAVPNFIALKDRASEAAVKTNMHTLQLHAEDYGVQTGGVFSDVLDATHIAGNLPDQFSNPYNGLQGSGVAWENRDVFAAPASSITGITSYADSATMTYNVKGYAKGFALPLVLVSSQ